MIGMAAGFRAESAETCRYTEFSARPLRDKPYYFDIHDDNSGAETRHFFSLQK